MKTPRAATPGNNGDLADSLTSLLRAGLELGVAEAARRLALIMPAGQQTRDFEAEAALNRALITEFVQAVREDSAGVFQLVKEVWSRGDTKERKTAARALGRGLSKVSPHKALGLSRELAAMSRTSKEADVVGVEAIGPILEQNPPLFERVKQFLQDNEVWVRRAAIAGLVAYVSRRKKLAGTALSAILLVVEHNEAEIRAGIRWAVRESSKVDWRGTAKALAEWAETDPARLKLAKQYAQAAAEGVRDNVTKLVFTRLAKFADGAKAPRARAARSR